MVLHTRQCMCSMWKLYDFNGKCCVVNSSREMEEATKTTLNELTYGASPAAIVGDCYDQSGSIEVLKSP